MKNERILLSLAQMGGREQVYIDEAFASNWVVPLGPNVNAFEASLAAYLGEEKSPVALSAGTAALHLALVILGVKAGDEVLCQSFTFAASANPIVYQGATPVFIDSEPDTWNISPRYLEEAIIARQAATGKLPKAIIPVHLYGMPAKMDEIMEIADRYGIPVIEDAAEALGSRYKDRYCGTFGRMSVLSFNGNKIITTSGGGALVCSTPEEAKKAMFYATQARDNAPHYQHTHIGYNYRMSNICAGIGRGQMEVLQHHVDRRRAIHTQYTEALQAVEGITVMQQPCGDFDSNYWLTCILIDEKRTGFDREALRLALEQENIESRPLWKPMHLQPVFADAPYYGARVCESFFDTGLCLPSSSSLTEEEVKRVVDVIVQLKSDRNG